MGLRKGNVARLALIVGVALSPLGMTGAMGAQGSSGPSGQRTVLPIPQAPFAGKVAPTVAASVQSFPERVKAPAGAPNVVLIMTDDVGFGVASTFGGPVPTPNLDRLAERGLLYNRFHTTALCSPTRAALLTGRNQHAVGSGVVTDMATGYPGYTTMIPKSAATVAEILKQNGYNTAMFGKHHNVPMWEATAAGPFDRWPTGLGFEYFYGFIGGATNQWHPNLFRGTSRVEQPDRGRPDSVVDRFLADDAIHWIHEQKASAPDKPFFLYFATGTAHSPHQAPKAWIDRFKGRFDEGWDVLRAETVRRQEASGVIPPGTQVTPRPEGLPAWDSLSSDDKRVSARMMEVFAGMIAYQDAQIGRILDEIDRMGLSEDTLVLFIEGDNGASPEGGLAGSTNTGFTIVDRGHEDTAWRLPQLDVLGSEHTQGHFPVGWTWALDAPFPWMKGVASHLGGVRNGLVVSWPGHIAPGGMRGQFVDVTDIAPTILDAAGIPEPESVNGVAQQPVDGISFAYSFADGKAQGRRRTQYFELLGTRGIYHNGWWAGTTPQRLPWQATVPKTNVTDWPWELYDLDHDFAQARNLAAIRPEKLGELKALWAQEAERNHVYPLDDRTLARFRINPYRDERTEYTYWGADIRVPDESAPPLKVRSFTIDADVEIPAGGGEGVLVALGGRFGGWSFYLKDGKPVALHAASQQPRDRYRVAADKAVPPGPAHIGFGFVFDKPQAGERERHGTLTVSVNGKEVARGRVEGMAAFDEGPDTFDVGNDTGSPVTDDYADNPRFNGAIRKVVVHLPDSERAPETE
ncbi:MAG: arylsulfatase [Novosphingobium sp.]|nr:arylsulfatase [Novosphingobium sp.]